MHRTLYFQLVGWCILVSHARLSYPKREKESGESCISQLYCWNVHCLAVVAKCLQSKPTLQDQCVATHCTALQLVYLGCVVWFGIQAVDHKNITVGQYVVPPNMAG